MADFTEVGDVLVQTIADIVYPNGTSEPSIIGKDIIVYQGWADSSTITQDLANGKVHISVFPRPNDKVTSTGYYYDEISNNGVSGQLLIELRRQTRVFQITIWASCFDYRDPVASAVDSGLAMLTRLDLPDGSQGIFTYTNSTQDDDEQKQGLYRRDLFYSVNYATTATQTATAIQTIDTSTQAAFDSQYPDSVYGAKINVQLTNSSITTTIED